VSKNEVIARLEALLVRVRTRSAEARTRPVHAAGPRGAASPPVGVKAAAARAVATNAVPGPTVAAFAATEPSIPAVAFAPAATEPSIPALIPSSVAPVPPAPPPAVAPALPLPLDEEVTFAPPKQQAPQVTEAEIVVDVEVQDTTQDMVIGVAPEEPVIPESAESRERLVAAEPVALDVTEPSSAPEPAPGQLESLPPGDLEAAGEEEPVEEGPASSRRPVAPEPEERLAAMAFGSEEPAPPRHTPPPESGRLPAAPIVEFDGDVTGVRDAQSIPQTAARASVTAELEPQATRPAVVPSDEVVDVLGEAQRFSPATFVALLDASLAL
jgi:hypothetical protein